MGRGLRVVGHMRFEMSTLFTAGNACNDYDSDSAANCVKCLALAGCWAVIRGGLLLFLRL